jgi:predicted metal-dependent RNase
MAAEEMLKEIKRVLEEETPLAGDISKVDLEGPYIVLYCRDFRDFVENGNLVKDLARRLKKRIILRPDPDLLMDTSLAEQEIKKIVLRLRGEPEAVPPYRPRLKENHPEKDREENLQGKAGEAGMG